MQTTTDRGTWRLNFREGRKSGRARRLAGWLVAALLSAFLLIALAACEGGFATTGENSKESYAGGRGQVEVEIASANGSTIRSFEQDYLDAVLEAQVTLEVEEGTFKIELLGEDREVTLVLEAGAGEQVSGSGTMVSDSFGEAEYRVTAEGAKGVHYVISYQVG